MHGCQMPAIAPALLALISLALLVARFTSAAAHTEPMAEGDPEAERGQRAFSWGIFFLRIAVADGGGWQRLAELWVRAGERSARRAAVPPPSRGTGADNTLLGSKPGASGEAWSVVEPYTYRLRDGALAKVHMRDK
jgi:hypothetical protein